MLKLHFSVTEDEATLLTVMTTGLATEVEVPRGKDVGFAKNRAIDKLWPSIPFCHAVAALSNLRIFDDQGEELNDGDACSALSEGQHLRLSAAPPGPRGVSAGPVSAGAQVFASTVSAVGRHKLGLDAAGPDSREELMKLPLKELKARLAASGLSAEGCLEKVFEHPTTADDSGLAACAPVPQVETQQKKVGAFNALFAVGALLGLKKWESGRFLPALGDSESGAVLAEFVSGTRKVPIETFFIDSRSAAFLQAAPEGKQLCEKIHFLGGLGVRELHGLRVAYLSGGRAVQRPTAASRSSFMGTAGLAMGPVLLLSGDIVTLGAGRGGDGTPLGSVRAPHGWVEGHACLGLWKRLTSRRGRMGRAASASDLGVDITQEEVELTSHYGRLELIALTPAAVRRAERVPTVLVNVGCYYTLADTLVAVEGPRYVAQGYAYVLWRASGPLEEVADLVFQRWRADAAVVLDWLGQQSWCDGRVGCHGYSLLGNTSYATLAASHAPDAPAERPLVRAAVPAISFSRIQPTVFVRGQSLAAELALCFLWLAEKGLCQGRLTGFSYIWNMFGFFGLPDWPGLAAALAQRPVDRADVDMWGRANTLWQGGQFARDELESFWKDGRDRQFNFDSFRGTHPPHIHIIAGWNDMFLQQGLDDFVSACRLTEARLTIYTGGHFGLITKHAGEVAAETGRCYREHLGGDMLDHRSPVRMQLITTTDETEWLECETWPPPCDSYLDYFLLGEGATGRLAEEAGSCRLSYTYDPKDPTPYAGDGWLNLQKDGAQDQRGLESSRTKDLLLASSQALEKDVDLAGEVQVSLSLRCSAPQCDVVARLCVVRGAGGAGGAEGVLGWLGDLADPRQLGAGQSVNLCENIVRAEFQKDEATRLDFRVGFTACRLNAGDRVRLHLCSAAHPRWLRHPLQPKGEDWLLGDSQVGPPAVISVETPSRLRLPLRSAELRSVFLTSP
ncbi:unnamed protein product [Durusdinium trenchii]|uniref:Xaa-Pro dipeptidyl-peptidase C-terminal domain-containing protein n=1 Tax=Durusdinium trenchii TaxID=1381693 RepID=A0ABP0R640_9DINO